jgi:hypothetical protein
MITRLRPWVFFIRRSLEWTSIKLAPESSMNRRFGDLRQREMQLAAFFLVEVTGSKLVLVHTTPAQANASATGRRHFEREDGHGFHLRMRRDVLGVFSAGTVLWRARRQDDQFTGIQAAGHFIKLRKSGAGAGTRWHGIEERVRSAGFRRYWQARIAVR